MRLKTENFEYHIIILVVEILKRFVLRNLNFIQKYWFISKSFWWFYANFVFIVFGSSWRARCLTAGTCAAHFMPCVCSPPIQVLHPDKNTLLQVIIWFPLVLYWQRFLFRDFPKFKVLKIRKNLEKSQSGKKKSISRKYAKTLIELYFELME